MIVIYEGVVGDADKARSYEAAHRGYWRNQLENGRVVSAGLLNEPTPSVAVLLNVDTVEEADEMIAGDPLVRENAFSTWSRRQYLVYGTNAGLLRVAM